MREKDLGNASDSIFGYYDMETNRMTMYDMSGVAAERPSRGGVRSQMTQFLASPNAPASLDDRP